MEIFMDEAGRGPLAWPLYIGLVVSKLSQSTLKKFPLFRDSKQLSAKQRSEAYTQIQRLITEKKLIGSIASVDHQIIDCYWITRAIFLAVSKGLYQLISSLLDKKLESSFTLPGLQNLIAEREAQHNKKITLILDGKSDFWLWKALGIQTETIVHGDAQLPEIAIASLLAKVSRDTLMEEYALQFPQYWFEKHKGYGTKAHYQVIEKEGISPLHRKLFLKSLFPDWEIHSFWDDEVSLLLN